MFELVYAFTCLDLQVYGGVLSRDAYETVGVTDDVRARLRARLRALTRVRACNGPRRFAP